jgi:phage tail sheath protein FI
MPLDPKTPGVYVQEVSIFPPSVVSVATAIPAFIGYTTKAKGTTARITSMNDYVANFGGPQEYYETDGATTFAPIAPAIPRFILYYCMQMYFANGGGPCWVVSTGTYSATPNIDDFWKADLTGALNRLELEDEPTLIVMPDLRTLTATIANQYTGYQKALEQCNKLQDRFTIIDLPEPPSSFRTGIGTSNLKYGAAYYPDLDTSLAVPFEAVRFSSAAPVGLPTVNVATAAAASSAAWLGVEKAVRKLIGDYVLVLPPSSTIAGVYASVDRDRGVWKAPANVSLTGVLKPAVTITNDDQETLNVDTTGKSINAIRAFTGKGILVWGSRTLAGNDNEWRYVPVRRLFIMAEESIRKATEWVVFEPNDANTWLKVKTMIENYLSNLWKDGALAGATPKDAFFVKVGLNQTMTAQDILEGKLIIEIGMAAVRPAEFVILKFSHKLQES